jgi:hypothetical protein
MVTIPEFKTNKELFDFLVANKESLVAQKCAAVKNADGFGSSTVVLSDLNGTGTTQKAVNNNPDEIKIKAVINTTNYLDSHGDVHVKGIWNKSVKENKRILHVQEHKSSQFDKIISSGEDLKASVKTYTWKELGYDAEGETEALVFDSVVKRERNPYMFEQYSKGYVDNHSVGMRYVKLDLAIDDKDYPTEKALFDEVLPQIVNRKDAERAKHFWVVSEAKAIEGSSVPMGSNPITPTIAQKNEVEVVVDKKTVAIKAFLGL